MNKINKSDDVTELISLLKSDVLERSDFLKQPVDLVEKKLYPIKNYGSAMTPFYTVLSLWVGILLLMSLLSTNVHGDYKPNEIYFGRGLTFLRMTIIQALIVSLGDIYLLKAQVLNIPFFILISIFTSIVFTVNCILFSFFVWKYWKSNWCCTISYTSCWFWRNIPYTSYSKIFPNCKPTTTFYLCNICTS